MLTSKFCITNRLEHLFMFQKSVAFFTFMNFMFRSLSTFSSEDVRISPSGLSNLVHDRNFQVPTFSVFMKADWIFFFCVCWCLDGPISQGWNYYPLLRREPSLFSETWIFFEAPDPTAMGQIQARYELRLCSLGRKMSNSKLVFPKKKLLGCCFLAQS
jgi:hypothetical protein